MGKKDKPVPAPPAAAAAAPAEQFDMVFHCQLAHGSSTRQIRDFTNVKQLYESIAKAFSGPPDNVKTSDILYCTLNTHKVDMSRLLGGQIGLDDFLFAHVKGQSKNVKILKDGPALGLTISDNGAGYAFIKKIREDSIMSKVANIAVGDHIQSINGLDLTGSRHFEVARMLKEIPIGSEFSIIAVEPRKQAGFDQIAPRAQMGVTKTELKPGEARKTLRMKSNGPAVVEDEPAKEDEQIISKIDDFLEKFIGIRDSDLSMTMYTICKECKEADAFATQLDSQLADFEFPDDFVLDVFELVHKQKS